MLRPSGKEKRTVRTSLLPYWTDKRLFNGGFSKSDYRALNDGAIGRMTVEQEKMWQEMIVM